MDTFIRRLDELGNSLDGELSMILYRRTIYSNPTASVLQGNACCCRLIQEAGDDIIKVLSLPSKERLL